MSSAGTNGIYLFYIAYWIKNKHERSRIVHRGGDTPRQSFPIQALRALARERSARGPRRNGGEDTDLRLFRYFSNKKQPHAASSGTFTRAASLFSLGLHLTYGILCVRHWRGSARHLQERQTLETGVFDQDVCPAVKVHLRVRNILNSLFDSL